MTVQDTESANNRLEGLLPDISTNRQPGSSLEQLRRCAVYTLYPPAPELPVAGASVVETT